MNAQQILMAFLAICSPFLLSFLIVAILAPRFKSFAERNGWTVQPHPEDHRDYLFKGQQSGIHWEMEYYLYEHYRKLKGRYIPFTQVIVWSSSSGALPQNTLLLYPRRDKLRHIIHPRLLLENKSNLVTDYKSQKLETFLFGLPEKAVGLTEFQNLFALRTDLETVPSDLLALLQFELLSWTMARFAGPVILVNSNGITIWWIPLGMQNEWLEKTVRLGISLAGNL